METIKSALKSLWNNMKVVVLAIGAILVAINLNKLRSMITLFMGKKELENADKKDVVLKTEQAELNDTANQLVSDAQSLPGKQESVGLDWNRKK